MRVAVNLEFTDEELRKYAEDVGRRWILNFIHEGVAHLSGIKFHPSWAAAVQHALATLLGPLPTAATASPTANAEPAHPFDRCVWLSPGDVSDEGWVCHECDTLNGAHRAICRGCDHLGCYPPTRSGKIDAEFSEEPQPP